MYKTLRKWYPNLAAALVGVLVTAVIGLVATSQAATIVVALVLLTALTIGIHYDLPVKVYRAIRFIDEHDTRTFNLSFWGILGIMLVFTIAMGIYGELKARYQWRALAGDIEAYYSNIQTQQGKLEGEAVGATGPRAFELHKQADVLDYSADSDAFVVLGNRIAVACETLAQYGFLSSGPVDPHAPLNHQKQFADLEGAPIPAL